jgi:hypothetical protein
VTVNQVNSQINLFFRSANEQYQSPTVCRRDLAQKVGDFAFVEIASQKHLSYLRRKQKLEQPKNESSKVK